jgi:predicted CXXCH cytochrome family protein
LSPALQSAICEQCHLQGEERVNRRGRDLFEYRPGLPFEQFVSVHVRHPAIFAENRSVGQFEQMEQSRCFTAGRGQLLCTTCHDPHAVPEPPARDAHYRDRCRRCHEPSACVAPPAEREAKKDSCVACHMPKAASSNIIHASVTDHRIPRRPDAHSRRATIPFGTPPLIRFRSGPLSPPREEQERDLGIALARFSRKPPPRELAGHPEPRLLALERLTASLSRWPGDADAWLAVAGVRTDHEPREKLRAARAAAALDPASEAALAALAEAATAAGDYELAVQTADEWVRQNPAGFEPLLGRAFVHLSREDWVKAEEDARAAIRLHPLHPRARMYLAVCLRKLGDPAAALREAQTAARLESSVRERELLMDWYRRATQ